MDDSNEYTAGYADSELDPGIADHCGYDEDGHLANYGVNGVTEMRNSKEHWHYTGSMEDRLMDSADPNARMLGSFLKRSSYLPVRLDRVAEFAQDSYDELEVPLPGQ